MNILKSFEAPALPLTFLDPDSGYKFMSDSREQLLADIIRYREQNQLDPINHLPQVLENYWCSLPENAGKCEPSVKMERTLYQYLKGGVALLKSYVFEKFVTQEQADERASLCITCPLNVFPDKGPFVHWSDDMAERSIGDRRSVHYDELGNCDGCGCLLKSKVWYGDKITLTKEEHDKIKSITPNCWQLISK